MKVLIIGGNGLIGSYIVSHLSTKYQVLIGGRSGGDINIDIRSNESVGNAFKSIPDLHHVINVAGEAKWDSFDSLSDEDFRIGLESKLMGQVRISRWAAETLPPGGSITLSTGILADHPVPMTTSAAMVNGGIHSFVKAAALELKDKVRINAVSVGLVQPAYDKYKDYFLGHIPVSMDKVIKCYDDAIHGKQTGQIFRHYSDS